MSFGWKLLVPLSFLNIILTAVVLFYGFPLWVLSLISFGLLAATFAVIRKNPGTNMERHTVHIIQGNDLKSLDPYANQAVTSADGVPFE